MKIILASASPRRREIMDKLNLSYRVIVPNIDETLNEELPLEKQIEDLAYRKAMAIKKNRRDDLVIAADTVVVVNHHILGKPHSLSEARKMMKMLSGKTHRVITSIAILGQEEYVDHDVAYVTFSKLNDQEIEDYIQTREPYDKAGGYA
ncbi:MAG: septum formation protein Maf, partial [Erysipelotrichaceae bacterium]|nr:septum formation protein Maf [Erysipelotrichaceae bacterium]